MAELVTVPLHVFHWCNYCNHRNPQKLEDMTVSEGGLHACAYPDRQAVRAFRADGYVYTCDKWIGKRWSGAPPVARLPKAANKGKAARLLKRRVA